MSSTTNDKNEIILSVCPRNTEGNYPAHDVYQIDFKISFLGNFRRLVNLFPERECLHSRSGFTNQPEFINKQCYDINLTYHQANIIINVLGIIMKKQLGLKKGDCIAIMCKNSPFWLLLDLAVTSIGGILVPLYDTLGPEKLAYCSNLAKIKAVFTQESNFGLCLAVASNVKSLKCIICVDGIKDIIMEFPEFFSTEVKKDDLDKKTHYLMNRKYIDYNIKEILCSVLKSAIPIFAKHFYQGNADVNVFSNTLSDDAASMYSINFSAISNITDTTNNNCNNDEINKEDVPTDYNEDIIEQMPMFDINNFNYNSIQQSIKNINEEVDEEKEIIHMFYLHPLISNILNEKNKSKEYSIYKVLMEYVDEKISITDPTKIIFTSGSSGPPKGVVHSHKSLMHGSESTIYRLAPIGNKRMIEYSSEELEEIQEIAHEISVSRDILYNKDHPDHKKIYAKFNKYNELIGQDKLKGLEHPRGYFFMPLAHCYDSAVELGCLCCHPLSIYYLCISASNLVADLSMSKPDLLIGVPRVFTKLQAGIEKKLLSMSPIIRKIFKLACDIKNLAMRYSDYINITGHLSCLDNTIFKSVHQMLGGNLKVIVSGSAAIPNDTIKLLKAISCSGVMQGFGMSESAAGGSVSPSNQCYKEAVTLGPMGVASPGVLAKVIDRNDICEFTLVKDRIGELCIKGPCMASHYMSKTEMMCDKDGWYHTGDLVKVYTTRETISVNPKTKKGYKNRLLMRPLFNIEKLSKASEKIDYTNTQIIDYDLLLFKDFDPTYKKERELYNLPKLTEAENKKLITEFENELKERLSKITYDPKNDEISYYVDNLIFIRRAAAVVKTQCGEFLDLELIENTIENSPMIMLASVHASADKTFPVAILSVDSNALLTKLNQNKIEDQRKIELDDIIEYKLNGNVLSNEEAKKSMKILLTDPEKLAKFKRLNMFIKPEFKAIVHEILEGECAKFLKLASLKNYCLPRAFHITFDDDWNDQTLLTATIKKQRKGIISYFGSIIDYLYSDLVSFDLKSKSGCISFDDSSSNPVQSVDKKIWILIVIVVIIIGRAIWKSFKH